MKSEKNTKIVATVSDLNCSESLIKGMYDSGMNVVRLNTAHQDFEGSQKVIDNVKKVSNKIGILLDTKGPEIRTSIENEINVKEGQEITIKTEGEDDGSVFVNYKNFVNEVEEDSIILIDDGEVELKVVKKSGGALLCNVLNEGRIGKRKSVNVPGCSLNVPSLSEKDRKYIEFAIDSGCDIIAHSFVRNKEDVMEIQKILDKKNSDIKIIAKIENQEGIDNIEEILDNVHGIMVARGDLGVEIPKEKVPHIQRELIKKSIKKRRCVIVATQMLHSMMENPRPTRAEVSDVANAVYSGTDAIMLSGETAYGKYPIKSVETMKKIAKETEEYTENFSEIAGGSIGKCIPDFIANSAVKASFNLPVKSIVVDTLSGRSARYLSAFRGKIPIYATCYNESVMRQLSLFYGVYADYSEKNETPTEFISKTVIPLLKEEHFCEEDLIVVLAGSFGASHGASFMEISSVKNLISKEKSNFPDDKIQKTIQPKDL